MSGVDLAAAVSASADVEDDSDDTDGRPRIRLTGHVAGEPVTADEIRFLLDQGSSLVFFREHWIEVDRAILREALRALEKGAGKKQDALNFALGLGHVGSLEGEEARAHGGLRGEQGFLVHAAGLAALGAGERQCYGDTHGCGGCGVGF